jgi:hypothetical protein
MPPPLHLVLFADPAQAVFQVTLQLLVLQPMRQRPIDQDKENQDQEHRLSVSQSNFVIHKTKWLSGGVGVSFGVSRLHLLCLHFRGTATRFDTRGERGMQHAVDIEEGKGGIECEDLKHALG